MVKRGGYNDRICRIACLSLYLREGRAHLSLKDQKNQRRPLLTFGGHHVGNSSLNMSNVEIGSSRVTGTGRAAIEDVLDQYADVPDLSSLAVGSSGTTTTTTTTTTLFTTLLTTLPLYHFV